MYTILFSHSSACIKSVYVTNEQIYVDKIKTRLEVNVNYGKKIMCTVMHTARYNFVHDFKSVKSSADFGLRNRGCFTTCRKILGEYSTLKIRLVASILQSI